MFTVINILQGSSAAVLHTYPKLLPTDERENKTQSSLSKYFDEKQNIILFMKQTVSKCFTIETELI